MRTLAIVAVAALACSLAAGCKKKVDRAALEAEIKKTVASANEKVLSVECPDDPVSGTGKFCTATVDGGVVYKVSLTPTEDRVNYEVTSFTVDRAKIGELLLAAVKEKAPAAKRADCGQGPVELPGTLDCTLGDAAGVSQKYKVTFDKNRRLHYEPAAPASPAP